MTPRSPMGTAENRTTTYRVDHLADGTQQRATTAPSGLQSRSTIGINATTTTASAEGTVVALTQGPDPRFGMQAPLAASERITTPGGLVSTSTTQRLASLADITNLLSLTSLTDTLTINGQVYSSSYDTGSRTTVRTTPAGRQTVTTVDAQGRPLMTQVGSLAPVRRAYDARGRLATIRQGTGAGTRTTAVTYNPEGLLDTITDATGRTVSFGYDAAGRVTTQTLPDSRVIAFDYDANGNLASMTPPGRPTHGFGYTPVDRRSVYTPPQPQPTIAEPRTLYSYNLDRQLTEIARPDGLLMDFLYDLPGRLSAQLLPGNQSVTYGYDPDTGQVVTITAPDGGTLSFTYDGSLLLSETWAGTVSGSVSRTYDNSFRVASQRVDDVDSVSLSYDQDSLLTGTGALSATRDAQAGLLTGTTLGQVSDTYNYSELGEVAIYEADVNGTPAYAVEYTRDLVGRITEKAEIIQGVTHTYAYDYDVAGRLTDVTTDGAPTTHYDYDANGNRVGGLSNAGPISATYDNQDRLLTYGAATYSYTANGELFTKVDGSGTTTFTYDVLGNLRTVVLPSGDQIDYVVDGKNRRIGKKVNGALVHGWLYDGQLRIAAELDGSNQVASRFVYGSRANVPEYMIKGSATYRILTDHLGSPRLVLNVADGTVVQRMDYDEFGNMLVDTNPGFQPFGFAGGLYDRATKLVRFGARDYDAATGRWTAKDPIRFGGGDTNLYGYVVNDPVNAFDPYGATARDIAEAYAWLAIHHPELLLVQTFAVGGGRLNYDPTFMETGMLGYLGYGGMAFPYGIILIDPGYSSMGELVGLIVHEMQHDQFGWLYGILNYSDEQHAAIYRLQADIWKEYEAWLAQQERRQQCLP